MFSGAVLFNQPIGSWDVSSVETLTTMFYGASSFNQDISGWDVSNVQYMNGMFSSAYAFDQDISSWDVSNVEFAQNLFENATSFNQNLNGLCFSQITEIPAFFSFNSSLELNNYPSFGSCNNIRIAENGVTIICPNADIGDMAIIR